MKILMTGGTGFIGSTLLPRLHAGGHEVTVLSRRPGNVPTPAQGIETLDVLPEDAGFDVVINLAGEPIADKRWSAAQKRRITDSRLDTTRRLIDYFAKCTQKPGVFISASAIGYYGVSRTEAEVDEDARGDDSFSSQLCRQWEAVALEAESMGIRTCLLRTGIVLGAGGGALGKMLLPFKLGMGGRIGDGAQWMPWIHLEDLVGIILFCIEQHGIHGAVNGTAPEPVTNREFTTTLGSVLHRPTLFTMPAFIVRLLMGQMGEELLLSGKRVLPKKMLRAGYEFRFQQLDAALDNILDQR